MRPARLLCTGLLGTLAACLGPLGPKPYDEQTPPSTGRPDIDQWLEAGFYEKPGWRCESAVHKARSPSPHGFNRLCSNKVITDVVDAALAAGTLNGLTAPWPKGAAAVKEIYTAETATEPVGYAVYLKTDDNSDGGKNWYWYLRASVKLDFFPQDANGVSADSKGGSSVAKGICVACHVLSGTDCPHTPSDGGHDEVYTPVAPMSRLAANSCP